MNGVPKFALGGLVEGFNRSMLAPRPMLAPAIATAGATSLPGKSFDLVIGNERFADLFAPDETAERLVRFAIGTQDPMRLDGSPDGMERDENWMSEQWSSLDVNPS